MLKIAGFAGLLLAFLGLAALVVWLVPSLQADLADAFGRACRSSTVRGSASHACSQDEVKMAAGLIAGLGIVGGGITALACLRTGPIEIGMRGGGASAMTIPTGSAQFVSTDGGEASPEQALEALAQMRASGVIGEDEYERMRANVIASI